MASIVLSTILWHLLFCGQIISNVLLVMPWPFLPSGASTSIVRCLWVSLANQRPRTNTTQIQLNFSQSTPVYKHISVDKPAGCRSTVIKKILKNCQRVGHAAVLFFVVVFKQQQNAFGLCRSNRELELAWWCLPRWSEVGRAVWLPARSPFQIRC